MITRKTLVYQSCYKTLFCHIKPDSQCSAGHFSVPAVGVSDRTFHFAVQFNTVMFKNFLPTTKHVLLDIYFIAIRSFSVQLQLPLLSAPEGNNDPSAQQGERSSSWNQKAGPQHSCLSSLSLTLLPPSYKTLVITLNPRDNTK